MSGDLREYWAPRDSGLLVNRIVETAPPTRPG